MMRDVKQASFRLNAEDTERFKAFCEEGDLTAAQGFAVLMEILELDRAGKALPARKTEIENFEQLTKSMVSAYLHSLELNENAENRVREQFAMQLESNARTINDYQEQVSALQLQLEEAVNFAESYRTDMMMAQENAVKAENNSEKIEKEFIVYKADREKQLSDKDNIIAMLSEKLMVAEGRAKGYDELEAQNLALRADLDAAKQTIKDIKKDAEIERERVLRDAEISLERAVREAEKRVEADLRKEIGRLQSQNMELLQTVAAMEREANEQIRALDKENGNLRETIASLRAKLERQENEG